MRNLGIAILVGSSLSLGACTGGAEANRSVYSVKQPVVERAQYVIDLNRSTGGLAGGEAIRLSEWMDALEVGYGDTIGIDYGGGATSVGVRRDIAAVAGSRGLLIADYAPITSQPLVPGTVRVVLSRSQAYVPGCPDWDMNSQADFQNRTHSNYGCATNSNLAAMVANPEDLVRGQKGEPSVRSGVEAIKQYREAGPRYGEGDLTGSISQSGGDQ